MSDDSDSDVGEDGTLTPMSLWHVRCWKCRDRRVLKSEQPAWPGALRLSVKRQYRMIDRCHACARRGTVWAYKVENLPNGADRVRRFGYPILEYPPSRDRRPPRPADFVSDPYDLRIW